MNRPVVANYCIAPNLSTDVSTYLRFWRGKEGKEHFLRLWWWCRIRVGSDVARGLGKEKKGGMREGRGEKKHHNVGEEFNVAS